MGLRYRKSIKLGPMRINLSKSGIGWSVGVKGARFTKKANGGYRTTMSVPGTGVSYVKDYSAGSAAQNQDAHTQDPQQIDPAQREQILSQRYEQQTKKTGSAAKWVVGFLVAALIIAAVFIVPKLFDKSKDAISTEDIPKTAIWYPESRITFASYPGSVRPGDHVSITAHGFPNTVHNIVVLVGDDPIKSTDLISMQSSITGNVSWDWDIPDDAAPGQYYIIVAAGDYVNCIDYAILDAAGNVVGDAPAHDDPYAYLPDTEQDEIGANLDMEYEPAEETWEEQPADTQQTADPAVTIVYVTESGSKYHNAGCRHLSDSSIPISLTTAEDQGYTACKDCH